MSRSTLKDVGDSSWCFFLKNLPTIFECVDMLDRINTIFECLDMLDRINNNSNCNSALRIKIYSNYN